MNKLMMAFCLTITLSVGVFAQTDDEEYNKNEFYVGYSNQQVGNSNRRTFNGFETSYVRNFNRYFGIKGDFSAAYRNKNFNIPVIVGEPIITGNTTTIMIADVNADNNSFVYNFLGGIQIKDNASKTRIKPFAHALVGAVHNRSKTENVTCISNCSNFNSNTRNFSSSDIGFGGAFGGGLDIKINDRIDFRAIQFDYNPVYSRSSVNNNFRFGIGFVFK